MDQPADASNELKLDENRQDGLNEPANFPEQPLKTSLNSHSADQVIDVDQSEAKISCP